MLWKSNSAQKILDAEIAFPECLLFTLWLCLVRAPLKAFFSI